MKKNPLSVILMVHNEEETIGQEVKSYYREIVKKIPGSEMIIVDDGNTDKTGKILHRLTKKLPLIIIPTVKKIGYASSLRLSLKKAKGELIFYADAGGKHDPRDFWKLYKKINKADFITGYKKHRNDPWYRLLLAWGLNTVVNLYFGVSFKDIDCGFKLFNQQVKKSLLNYNWILNNNITLEVSLIATANGYKTEEVPITHFARPYGESRGLPLKKIPNAVAKILIALPKLKAKYFCKG